MKKKVYLAIAVCFVSAVGILGSSYAGTTTLMQLEKESGSSSVTRPLLQNTAGAYYCGCTCTTSCGAICK